MHISTSGRPFPLLVPVRSHLLLIKILLRTLRRSLLEMEIEEPGDAPAGVAADPVSAESPLSDAQST
jgi:hypothetical protein